MFLQVLTNGRGRSADYREQLEREGVSLHAEVKSPGITPPWFTNTRIVPVDRDPNCGIKEPCGIFGLRGCGIGLTRHGYFLDGAGATIARIAGYDIGIMKLKDLTWQAMIEQSKTLCRLCGHWTPFQSPVTAPLISVTGEVTGKFWTEALEKYQKEKPKLRVYGEA